MSKVKINMVKLTTQSIWVLSHIYCWVWKLGRNLFRKSDFDYFIRNLQKQYPTTSGIWTKPFFHKVDLVNDDYEKSRSVKIGNVTIEYSFDKTLNNPSEAFLLEVYKLVPMSPRKPPVDDILITLPHLFFIMVGKKAFKKLK